MLPSKTCFQISGGQTAPTKVLSLRLPEELAKRLVSPNSPIKLRLQMDPNDPAKNKLLLGEDVVLPLTFAPETQIVDVARSNLQRRNVQIVGRVKEKLAVKQELAQDKALAIRLQSELAEKERLSRKTMTIDEPIKNNGGTGSKSRSVLMGTQQSAASSSSRNRLLQRVNGGKKSASVASMSPKPSRPPPPTQTYSEKMDKSSTISWSPTIDVFSKPPEPVKTADIVPSRAPPRAKRSKSSSEDSVGPSAPVAPLNPVYQSLLNKFQAQLDDYKKLEHYMDRRLAIFEQLQKDLKTASGNASATDRITNRVAVETNALNADKEYKWKLAEMNQLRQELESLRFQMDSLSPQ